MTTDPILQNLSTVTGYLTLSKTAELLSISTDTLHRRIKDGSIGFRKEGRKYLFSPAHITKYIEDRTYTVTK
jgi:excisionase family DNA binding protein